MPFHRDVDLSPSQAAVMLATARACQLGGGALVLTPEQRLSMELKRHELALPGAEARHPGAAQVGALLEQLQSQPYRDLFDESDELFRVVWKLVYAVGEKSDLPGGASRWVGAQSALRLLQHGASAAITELLSDRKLCKRGAAEPDVFAPLQLLRGDELDLALPRLCRLVARELLANPPPRPRVGHPAARHLPRADRSADGSRGSGGL